MKKLIHILLASLLLGLVACSTNEIQEPQDNVSIEEKVERDVSVSVVIPEEVENGTPLDAVTVTADEDDTIIDVTEKAGATIELAGTGDNAYVEGINGLKALDEGPSSGWLVKVNGEFINESAGKYIVKSEDEIEWVYTTDFTKEFEE